MTHYHELKQRVRWAIRPPGHRVGLINLLKLITLLFIAIPAYAVIIVAGGSAMAVLAAYALLGVLTFLYVAHLGHDAAHGSAFPSGWMNRAALDGLDLLGISGGVWRLRHVGSHHAHPNEGGRDADVEDHGTFLLDGARTPAPHHRWQHLYMPLVFASFSLYWILFRDFRDALDPRSLIHQLKRVSRRTVAWMIIGKLMNLTMLIALPISFSGHDGILVVGGFVLMHVVMSSCAFVVLVPTHVNELTRASFRSDQTPPTDRALLQLEATVDLGTRRTVLSQSVAHLNHHVAHHLFPAVSNLDLPQLTNAIERATHEMGLPYHHLSMRQGLRSHFRHLRTLGRPEDLRNAMDL